MLRNLARMAQETASKKLKTSPPLIGTHKSVFPIHYSPSAIDTSSIVAISTPTKP